MLSRKEEEVTQLLKLKNTKNMLVYVIIMLGTKTFIYLLIKMQSDLKLFCIYGQRIIKILNKQDHLFE